MIKRNITENFIFRFYKCGLSIEETAKLCFKSEITVTGWDRGKPIPPLCKRLMRLHSKRTLHDNEQWEGFEMVGDRLKFPTGKELTPSQILIGAALIENAAPVEHALTLKLMKYARAIAASKVLKRAVSVSQLKGKRGPKPGFRKKRG